jgi:hypothetical protein
MGPKPRAPIERFDEKWTPEPNTGCWLWTAGGVPRGYGTMRIGSPRRAAYAHRVSWELHRGPIPKGFDVCHKCDTPQCVNPDHLFLGTRSDNMQDCACKGRSCTGDRNGMRKHPERITRGSLRADAKLTETAAADIRERAGKGTPRKVLAAEYGVCTGTVDAVVNRRTWNHVP